MRKELQSKLELPKGHKAEIEIAVHELEAEVKIDLSPCLCLSHCGTLYMNYQRPQAVNRQTCQSWHNWVPLESEPSPRMTRTLSEYEFTNNLKDSKGLLIQSPEWVKPKFATGHHAFVFAWFRVPQDESKIDVNTSPFSILFIYHYPFSKTTFDTTAIQCCVSQSIGQKLLIHHFLRMTTIQMTSNCKVHCQWFQKAQNMNTTLLRKRRWFRIPPL